MGSTYSVAKKAATIVAANGTLYYALFEQTFESNVYPRTPRWSAVYFGTAEACTAKAVQWSASAEGGCLKGASGNITPAGYLRKWRDALANPVTLTRTKVCAQIKEGFYSIEPKHRDTIAAILNKHGLNLSDDKLEIDLVEKPAALQEILDATQLGGWRFFENYDFSHNEAPWAKYAPDKTKAKPIDVRVFYVVPEKDHEPDYWLVYPNGEVSYAGWEYSAIQKLISEYATQSEKERPGSAEHMIRQVRQCVTEERLPFPENVSFTICRDSLSSKWHQDSFQKLASGAGQPDVTRISINMRDVLQAGTFRELKYLPPTAVDFRQAFKPKSSSEQLDLLAA